MKRILVAAFLSLPTSVCAGAVDITYSACPANDCVDADGAPDLEIVRALVTSNADGILVANAEFPFLDNDGNENNSGQVEGNFDPGSYTVHLVSVDAAGHVSPESNALEFTRADLTVSKLKANIESVLTYDPFTGGAEQPLPSDKSAGFCNYPSGFDSVNRVEIYDASGALLASPTSKNYCIQFEANSQSPGEHVFTSIPFSDAGPGTPREVSIIFETTGVDPEPTPPVLTNCTLSIPIQGGSVTGSCNPVTP